MVGEKCPRGWRFLSVFLYMFEDLLSVDLFDLSKVAAISPVKAVIAGLYVLPEPSFSQL